MLNTSKYTKLDGECVLIAACIDLEGRAQYEIADLLQTIPPSAFDYPLYARVWEKARKLFGQEGGDMGKLLLRDKEFSPEELNELCDIGEHASVARSALPVYKKDFCEAYYKAKIEFTLSDALEGSVEDLRTKMLETLLAVPVLEETIGEKISDCVDSWYDNWESLYSGEKVPALQTGFKVLDDNSIFGLGDLVLLAGYTSHGKTTLALNIVLNILGQQKSVLYYSLEMSKKEIIMKITSQLARIPQFVLLNPSKHWGERNSEPMLSALTEIKSFDLKILDNAKSYEISEIISNIRAFKKNNPDCDLIVVDHLLLVKPSEIEAKQLRDRVLAEHANSLKRLAGELNVCILLLTQLNRSQMITKDKLPELSSIKDSSGIEQAANSILFVHRRHVFDRDNVDLKHDADLIVAKARFAELGNYKLTFIGEHSEFRDVLTLVR